MAPSIVAETPSPLQFHPAPCGVPTASAGHDLAPVVGLVAGLGAALLLWAVPVAVWLLLR